MDTRTAEKILNLTGNYTREDIKRSYYQKSRESHPDTGSNPEKFRKIKEAYDYLSIHKGKKKGYHDINLSSFSVFLSVMADLMVEVSFERQRNKQGMDVIRSLISYQKKVLAQDEHLGLPHRKLIDYFISLFLHIFYDTQSFSYEYLVIQNMKSSPQFEKIFRLEQEIGNLMYGFFIQFRKGEKMSPLYDYEKSVKKILRRFTQIQKQAFYHFNRDVKEVCDNLYFLLTTFDKIQLMNQDMDSKKASKSA